MQRKPEGGAVSDLQRRMAPAVRMSRERLERSYQHAVEAGVTRERAYRRARREEAARARGRRTALGNHGGSADVLEGYAGPHRAAVLLMLAAVRLPSLAAELARLDGPDDADDALWEFALVAARDSVGSTLGLAHLALEAHALGVGYGASARVGHALERARATLPATDAAARDAAGDLAEQVCRAAQAFNRAADAIADDGMRVADEFATGLGQILVLCAITSDALDA
jgi:hypothetical protein